MFYRRRLFLLRSAIWAGTATSVGRSTEPAAALPPAALISKRWLAGCQTRLSSALNIRPVGVLLPRFEKLSLSPNPERRRAIEDEFVRQWQARGWTLALHGFQHRYSAVHAGVVTPKKKTEFAGFPALEQDWKLRCGVDIFERHRIKSRVWIAPSNSFDRTTVSLLPQFGIDVICDGFFRVPFIYQRKILWIPQQLHGFRPAPPGVWTVCYHHNHWTTSDLAKFREDLARYRSDIGSLDEVMQTWAGRRSLLPAWLYARPRLAQLVIRCELKFWEWWVSDGDQLRLFKNVFRPADQGRTSN